MITGQSWKPYKNGQPSLMSQTGPFLVLTLSSHAHDGLIRTLVFPGRMDIFEEICSLRRYATNREDALKNHLTVCEGLAGTLKLTTEDLTNKGGIKCQRNRNERN